MEPDPIDEDSRKFSKGFPGMNMLGGAALTPFWEDGAEGSAAGHSIVVFGGSSSVGQFGE